MKHYYFQVLIAIDQLLNALFGGWADETISARTHRSGWVILEVLIDFTFGLLFFEVNHCRNSYQSEMNRNHLPPEYR